MTLSLNSSALVLVCALTFAGFSASVRGQGEPAQKAAFQCLSALAWQKEQQFQQPVNDKEAFRSGPFQRLTLSQPGVVSDFNLPWVSSVREKEEIGARMIAGLRSLHALDDEDAESWFRDVVVLDPQCASGWLGLAMANEKSPMRAQYFLGKAAEIKSAGAGEKRWIAAYQGFFDAAAGGDIVQRLNGLSATLQRMATQHPEDRCAEVFAMRYRLLASHLSGLPVVDGDEWESMMEQWLSAKGGGDLVGYGVLLWLSTNPVRASEWVKSHANRFDCPTLWRLAAQAFLGAGDLTKAKAYLTSVLREGSNDFLKDRFVEDDREQLRFSTAATLAWTSYHLGEFEEALAVAERLVTVPRKPAFTNLMAIDDAPASPYLEAHRLKVQLLAALGEWDKLAKFVEGGESDDAGLLAQVYRRYWAVIANAGGGERERATEQRKQLAAMVAQLGQTSYLNQYAELTTKMERGADAFMQLAGGRLSPFLSQISDVPVAAMVPLLVKAKAKEVALAKLDSAMQSQPGSVPLTRLAKELRDGVNGEKHVAIPKGASDEVERDWAKAPDLELPDKSGTLYTLSQFRGKPVLVIFFLGQGCAHCVEQLQKFKPQIPAFEKEGIRVVGIGTDSVEKLAEGLGKGPELNPDLPYLLLADPKMDAFKKWRCYDEFAVEPLHGTFLMDGDGRILWSDISHDPYVHAEFLVGECRRLLALPR
ncbi:redoxin domain-containing protein [Phragmitibacter flavus]|nr:redoxin domain-containing protein [Phragmitibacter flavus]